MTKKKIKKSSIFFSNHQENQKSKQGKKGETNFNGSNTKTTSFKNKANTASSDTFTKSTHHSTCHQYIFHPSPSRNIKKIYKLASNMHNSQPLVPKSYKNQENELKLKKIKFWQDPSMQIMKSKYVYNKWVTLLFLYSVLQCLVGKYCNVYLQRVVSK